MPALPAERERWLALGLLLAALALAYLLLVHPWWTTPMRDIGERIASAQQRELRLRTQLQQAPQVERRLAQVLASQRTRPGFLAEATPELATAGLVQRLETVVAQASPDREMLNRPVVRIAIAPTGGALAPPGVAVDLTERGGDGNFLRSIVKVTNPDRYGLTVGDYFL